MNSYQSMLTIGSIMLLSLASIRFNSSVLQNITVETENKVALTAFSLADDMIEIIKQKAFDAHTVDFPTTNPNSLTHPNSLGPANGETFDNFNDIDDYNNYTKYVSAPHAEDYYVSCKVHYVKEDNPDQISTVQTFYKRVSITVTSPYLKNPVKLSTVFTLK
jgi:hypothetical protein